MWFHFRFHLDLLLVCFPRSYRAAPHSSFRALPSEILGTYCNHHIQTWIPEREGTSGVNQFSLPCEGGTTQTVHPSRGSSLTFPLSSSWGFPTDSHILYFHFPFVYCIPAISLVPLVLLSGTCGVSRQLVMRWFQYSIADFEETLNPANGGFVVMERKSKPSMVSPRLAKSILGVPGLWQPGRESCFSPRFSRPVCVYH